MGTEGPPERPGEPAATRRKMTRGDFLRASGASLAGAGLAGLGLTAGCGAGSSGSAITVGTWGGDYLEFMKKSVVPALKDSNSEAEPTFAVGDQTQRMAKMRAEADGPGTFDVVCLADSDMQEMVNAGLAKQLEADQIGRWDAIVDNLENPRWIPHIYSANVVIYNRDQVQPAPTSYEVFWDPKYRGKIAIQTILWDNWFYASSALVKGGDPGNDWFAGWDRLQELADRVRVYPSQEECGRALMSGEAWLTLSWKARAYQWDQAGDTPLGGAIPDEGTFPVSFVAGVPKNAPDAEGAYAYLNAMLQPGPQQFFAKHMGYAPSVQDVELPEQLQKGISFTPEEREKIKPVDLQYQAKIGTEMRRKWQSTMVSG